MKSLMTMMMLLALSACQTESVDSDLKILGSTARHLSSSVNKIPGVMKIVTNNAALCTAQAVSDSTMISAAHCFSDFGSPDTCIASGENTGECSSKIYMPDQYLNNDIDKWKYDVAIIEFDKPIFKQYFEVRHEKNTVNIGEDFYVVGYSPNDNVSQNAAQCTNTGCWGQTKVSDIVPEYQTIETQDGRLRSGGAPVTEAVTIQSLLSDGATTRGGDSGGAAIDSEFCSVFGVLSRGDNSSSSHTNLTNTDVQNWLISSFAEYDSNIYICGIHGNDPERCSLEGVYHPLRVNAQNEIQCVTLNTRQPFEGLLDAI